MTGVQTCALPIYAMVVEAHAVDDALVFRNAEEARLRIAGLRFGRYRADFEEAEAERAQCVYVFAVFVESGGQPDRIRQADAHELDGLDSVVENRKQTKFINFVERVESEMVGFFGIEFEQQAAG